jgi:hypothetical protein
MPAKKASAKKRATKKKVTRKKAAARTPSAKGFAASVVAELEKASDVVLKEIKERFEGLYDAVGRTATATADTAVEMKDRLTSAQVRQQVLTLAGEVEAVAESAVAQVGKRFDALRKSVVKTAEEVVPAKKPARKKRAATKKAAKKKVAKKKAAKKKAAKKKTAKKKAAKKRAVSRKKAPRAKKKAGARKKAGRAARKA